MNKDKYEYFTISSNDSLKRLDNVIRRFLPNMPLKSIFKSIRSGDIRINSFKVKQNHRINEGDILAIYKPFLSHTKNDNQNENRNIQSINPKNVIYENRDILIFNKPRGVLVHGEKNSLDVQIRSYLRDKVEKSLSFSPGPLHRLDRNTQGLIVFSVSLKGARTFTNMMLNGEIRKLYLTVVDGSFNKKEDWEDSISRDEKTLKSFKSDDGKIAKTTFIPLVTKKNKTVALIEIKSGRTHQIRVQCSIHGRPLTGDKKYNNITDYKEYYLSAISLSFTEKSDILNISDVNLPFNKTSHNLIKDLLTDSELKKLETTIQKELKRP